MIFSSIKLKINAFMLLTLLSTCHIDSVIAMVPDKDEVAATQLQQPKFDPFVGTQEQDLICLAEGGDLRAQDQLIERNFWGFLNKQNERGLWGEGTGWGHRPINPISWDNIEERAIADTRYAYALIDNYSLIVRWNLSAPAFSVKFPKLFRTIIENSERGDICADFTLGVLHQRFQTFPQRIGFSVQPRDSRETAFELVKRAATRGHGLAMSAMGLLSYQGYFTTGGRNDIEPLRWYFASKENKISQEGLRQLLTSQRTQVQQEGTFQTAVRDIHDKLEAVWGRHLMHLEAHNPDGHYVEARFAIPLLGDQYKIILGVEEEALALIRDLQKANPGLLLTGTKIREVRDRKQMLEQQTVPFASVTSYEGAEYHTFGEENVSLAARLVSYLEGIDDRFAEAINTLSLIRGYYQIQLDFALSELMKVRVFAMAKKDEASAQRFDEQSRFFAELDALFKGPLTEIDEEHAVLNEVKELIKGIVTGTVVLRNQDFLREHPYL